MAIQQPSAHWIEDCEKWRGHLLTGEFAHWCPDWDDLPIDETTPEWPCACADSMVIWKLVTEHWVPMPQVDLDSLWQQWYALGTPMHVRFVCKWCKRQISGCGPKCTEKHRVEEVECCAFCAKDKTKKDE